jgi:hypothetical protein
MEAQFKSKVTYVGEEERKELAFVLDPGDGNVVNELLVFDRGSNTWVVKTSVPRRAPEDFEAGGGGGHTWH